MSNNSLVTNSKPQVIKTKIAVYRKGKYKTDKGWTARSLKYLWTFEKDNILTFSISQSAGLGFVTSHIFKLKVYKVKSGEVRFTFYKFSGDRFQTIRSCSPLNLKHILQSFDKKNHIPKSHSNRLLKVIKTFASKHNVSTKYLSNDPIHCLIQLCYPATIGFSDTTLNHISVGHFLKTDPLKSVLNTRGKYSKKLIYQTIQVSPRCCQSIFRLAKYYRINFSLDHAQQFLQSYIDIVKNYQHYNPYLQELNKDKNPLDQLYFGPLYHEHEFSNGTHSINSLSASTFNFLKKIPVTGRGSVLDLIQNRRLSIFRDTLSMIIAQNLNEGFNLSNIKYSTITELHDALVEVTPQYNGFNYKHTEPHYEFEESSIQNMLGQVLVKNYNNFNNEYRLVKELNSSKTIKYKLVYPKNTQELLKYANQMHNCSYYYKDMIKNNSYVIFCIQEMIEDIFKTKYMFGFKVLNLKQELNNKIKFELSFDQAVSYCNKLIKESNIHSSLHLIKRIYLMTEQYFKHLSLLNEEIPRTELPFKIAKLTMPSSVDINLI